MRNFIIKTLYHILVQLSEWGVCRAGGRWNVPTKCFLKKPEGYRRLGRLRHIILKPILKELPLRTDGLN
jgi:hypothetical protein